MRSLSTRICLGLLVLVTAVVASAATPEQASAGDCPANSYRMFAGTLSMEGACSEGQSLLVYCGAGVVRMNQDVGVAPWTAYRNESTGFACSQPARVFLFGTTGSEQLDLSPVSREGGFTGLSGNANLIEAYEGNDTIIGSGVADDAQGGPGDDTLRLRDGTADLVDCGEGSGDVAIVDPPSLDTVSNCETVTAAASPPPPLPANTARPQLSGKAKTGKTLTCEPGTWTGASSFAFAWLRNGDAIAGESKATLELKRRDGGRAIQCEVTATGLGGTAVEQSKPVVPKKAKR